MEYWDHTMGPQDRAALRAGAVQAVRNGEKKRHVAQRLGITRQTLHNWVEKHRRGGAAALVAKPRGRVRRAFMISPARDGASRGPDQTTTEASTQLL